MKKYKKVFKTLHDQVCMSYNPHFPLKKSEVNKFNGNETNRINEPGSG